jgi:general secretion pathway protein L
MIQTPCDENAAAMKRPSDCKISGMAQARKLASLLAARSTTKLFRFRALLTKQDHSAVLAVLFEKAFRKRASSPTIGGQRQALHFQNAAREAASAIFHRAGPWLQMIAHAQRTLVRNPRYIRAMDRIFAFPALRWWSEGLAAQMFEIADHTRQPRRYRLRANARPFVLSDAQGVAMGAIESNADSTIREPPAELLAQTRDQIIEIMVPPTAIIERRLDPLPAESRPYADNVVRHRIESLVPWRAADVLHTTATEERSDGRIDVIVRATSRTAIAPAIAAATAYAPRNITVVADAARDAALAIAVPISAAEGELGGSRAAARHAIAGLLFFAVCIVSWTILHWQVLASKSAALDQAISGRRSLMQRASNIQTGSELEDLKRRKPLAVRVLDQLSLALPDDTYLNEFHLEADKLRIAGVSGRAAELVAILERSGHFRKAAFYAPTTRMVGRRTDQFYIEAAVVPETGP